jgi:hypothetical protein
LVQGRRIEPPRRLDFWMQRLVEFLREWGVPPDTYLVGWFGDEQRGRLDVFPTQGNADPGTADDRGH